MYMIFFLCSHICHIPAQSAPWKVRVVSSRKKGNIAGNPNKEDDEQFGLQSVFFCKNMHFESHVKIYTEHFEATVSHVSFSFLWSFIFS